MITITAEASIAGPVVINMKVISSPITNMALALSIMIMEQLDNSFGIMVISFARAV